MLCIVIINQTTLYIRINTMNITTHFVAKSLMTFFTFGNIKDITFRLSERFVICTIKLVRCRIHAVFDFQFTNKINYCQNKRSEL